MADNSGQLGFDLGDDPKPVSLELDAAEVREDLQVIPASVRVVTADALWDERTYRYNKFVFPQMSCWLPDDECNQLSLESFQELERTEQRMAA